MLDVRKKYGKEHLKFLDYHSEQILLAGGTRYQPDTPFVGGMWIVKATTAQDVERIVQNDPYFDPVHRRYEISYWGLVYQRMETVLANRTEL
jgi:uncharacterized protein YciI